jgi:hypothetical protein
MKNLFITLAGTLLSASAMAAPGAVFLENCERPLAAGNTIGVVNPELAHVNESTQVLKDYLGAVDCEEAASRLATLTSLDLSHVKINSLVNISDLTQLQKLWIHGPELQDLTRLKNLDQLQDLWMIAGKARSLGGLEELRALASLSIVGESLIDIQALKGLTPKSLILDASALTEVSAIAELTSLTNLQLHVQSAPRIPALENLSGMKTFWISSDAVTDFSGLADLREVEDLWISAAHFNNLKPLASLANLKSLTIANSQLSSLDSLKELSAQQTLQHFHSVNNPVSNGEPLAGLSALKSLAVVGSNIRSTEFLGSLSQLQSLDLSQNPGIDLSNVRQKTGLKYLNIAASGLTQTDFLEGLSSLETFNAPYNQIAAAPQLKNLKSLMSANFSGNRLSQTYDFSDLTQMQILFLNDNPINGQVDGLLGLQSLEVLGLARTGLTGKPTFPSWKRLKIFDVSDNSINNVLAFGDLTDLETLHIANNQIRDFGPIVGASVNGSLQNVKILPWLYELRTAGNPVPFTGVIPSDAAISMLNNKGKDLSNDLINAEYNYDKVALLHTGGVQVTEDIICLRVYYHFKYMGVLNTALLASTPEKVGTLNDYLTPICTDDSCRASENPIKFIYGQDLDGCKQLGSVKNLSPDIKPIVSTGKTNTVKLSPKYVHLEPNAKQEVLETSTIKTALDKLFKSQSNASGSIREVQEAFITALNQARENAQHFLARVDRIRVSNHSRLQEAREKLREKLPSEENN